jgi:predicted nucleic acid-binding protein
MKLVVDTNILISFFRENPVRSIISNSLNSNLVLYSPEHCIKELLKISPSISKYSKRSIEEIHLIFEELKKTLKIIPDEYSKEFKEEAKELIHDKDIPIFALAIKLNCPIWSNEPRFKKQNKMPVFSTRDMIELMF